ncbi:hypothetical protein RDWZM_006617 [Blomia tropicalis]|uniref:Serine aminopeptidase S33 domain-containing protein n=1 Tax=Blomia tropicalis TaxID=40697 RepID=A0A9Q0MBT8_BLOTA|nr:hypothetical protein RDWZM_006617 [Blomia tropicalis]
MFHLSIGQLALIFLVSLFAIISILITLYYTVIDKTRKLSIIENNKGKCRCRKKPPGIVYGICCILCCPPCPPERVIGKAAFFPPEHTTYSFVEGSHGLQIKFTNERTITRILTNTMITEQRFFSSLKPFYVQTDAGNTIACIHIQLYQSSKFTILYSHSNACDIGHMVPSLFRMASELNCNVLSYDYSGFGLSTGYPSEPNQLLDAEAVWNELHKRMAIKTNQIILYGQSIGSVPTIYLGSKFRVAGIVLHSAFISGIRIYCKKRHKICFCFSPFSNIDRLHLIQSPILIIHGKQDRLVDYEHALELYRCCGSNAVEPLFIQWANHNNIESGIEYLLRLKRFIYNEIMDTESTSSSKSTATSKTGF